MKIFPLIVVIVAVTAINALAETAAESKLLRLANERFTNDLTFAEEKMFRAAAEGGIADCQSGSKKENDPARSATWEKNRIIRADRLVWICTDPTASALVTYQGIRIGGARIDGTLNLEWANVTYPLLFSNCVFSQSIILKRCHLRGFFLPASHIKNLDADGVKVEDDIFLSNTIVEGRVRFLGATIGGDLDCDGGQFINPNGTALNADGAKIEGQVSLSNARIVGASRFVHATIGGNLTCNGGELISPNSFAFAADSAEIKGSVYFDEGFKVEGLVRLRGTTIGRQLVCSGGRFVNTNGFALAADGAKIGTGIFLTRDSRGEAFKSEGEVRLLNAVVGGDLGCDGGQFINNSSADAVAINADSMKIGGSVYLRDGFKAEGKVQLVGATIGGDLDCTRGQFVNTNAVALNALGANIEGRALLCDGFQAHGEVRLQGMTVTGPLNCSGGLFSNTNDVALSCDGANFKGGVYLINGFHAVGKLCFAASDMGIGFQFRRARSPQFMILDLSLAKVGTLLDDTASWPKQGNLHLDGFVYDRIHADAPVDAASRIVWLEKQPTNYFLPQPYEQLATVLRTMGHEEAAKEIMIIKNQDRAKRTPWFSASSWWYHVFGPLVGYGYRPWWALGWSALTVVIGWLLFRVGYVCNIVLPADDDKAYPSNKGGARNRSVSEHYPKFCAFIYSLEKFVPLLNLDMAQHWKPNANSGEFRKPRFLSWGKLLRYYLWFHIILGWILTTLWVGALAGLVKT